LKSFAASKVIGTGGSGIHTKLCVYQGYTDRGSHLGGLSFALPGAYRLKKVQNARSDYTTSVWEY
jgi:hypothetical protein